MTMDQAIEQGFMDGEWYHVITGEFTINNGDSNGSFWGFTWLQ